MRASAPFTRLNDAHKTQSVHAYIAWNTKEKFYIQSALAIGQTVVAAVARCSRATA